MGLKPTHGIVPYTVIVSFETVTDHVAPICKNVMGVAVYWGLLLGEIGWMIEQLGHRGMVG